MGSTTAIYYILRSSEFNLSPFAYHFYHSDVIVTLLTWSTVIFQVSWPWLIWNHRTKVPVFLGAVCLHSMIGYFMGLAWFSAVMISTELIIFNDREYLAFYRRLGLMSGGARARLRLQFFGKGVYGGLPESETGGRGGSATIDI